MRITMLLIAAILVSASAQAQEPKSHTFADLAPYIVMVSGNAADFWTTHEALARGAHENNPLWKNDGIGKITAVKIVGTVGIAVMMQLLDKLGHPKAAKALGYIDGSITWGVAAHNHGVAR